MGILRFLIDEVLQFLEDDDVVHGLFLAFLEDLHYQILRLFLTHHLNFRLLRLIILPRVPSLSHLVPLDIHLVYQLLGGYGALHFVAHLVEGEVGVVLVGVVVRVAFFFEDVGHQPPLNILFQPRHILIMLLLQLP